MVNYWCKQCSEIDASLRGPEYYREYAKSNKKSILRNSLKYSRLNKESNSLRSKEHRKKNPKLYAHHSAKRRAAKLQRTPSYANLKAVQKIYEECPEGMQVDHIIPLQGKTVSGLHVENNLQYLTPSENAAKGNSYP